MPHVVLPAADGSAAPLVLGEPARLATRSTPPTCRAVYAAAHVVADPRRACAENPGPDQIDWDATARLRHDLWSQGLGVAESMDTAQRGMGLDWDGARELAVRTLTDAKAVGGKVVVGVGTDQLTSATATLPQIRDAYLEQVEAIESAGGEVVLMASRHLARAAAGPDDYLSVYDAVLSNATRPVVLHWLGSVFDPALQGYWGFAEPKAAMDTVLAILTEHKHTVRGIKVSVLDPAIEVALRERMPDPVRVFTGDDYNYVDLIAGDGSHTSDALLGAFAAIGPFASAAFTRLDAGDEAGFRNILGPTESLSRLIFAAPTQYYKVGVAWLAYLNGKQDHFRMIGGFETGRSLTHLADLVRAADAIGLFTDPEFTAARAAAYFAVHGLD
jgi:Protein of unknown function (DUF993)